MHVGYWCTDNSKMRYGSNQHNNQLIYYIRDIKVVGPAHSSALDDLITGEDMLSVAPDRQGGLLCHGGIRR